MSIIGRLIREGVAKSMRSNTSRDTKPELRLRRALHASGLRFIVDAPLPVPGVRRRADAVFPRARVAVFMDGCFWHGCAIHFRPVNVNADYWNPKIKRNMERDRQTDAMLADLGWHAVRIWEHELRTDAGVAEVVAEVRLAVNWRPR
jgi:DNA mismatch endonuclease (patch repair protein)